MQVEVLSALVQVGLFMWFLRTGCGLRTADCVLRTAYCVLRTSLPAWAHLGAPILDVLRPRCLAG